jgi:hypothetical protein
MNRVAQAAISEAGRRWVLRLAVLSAGVLAGALGCRGPTPGPPTEEPESLTNPFGFRRVAVLPFVNLTGESSPESEAMVGRMAAVFYEELQRVEGLRVAPPSAVAEGLGRVGIRVTGPADALELAKALDVEAVVVGAVTSYDPYYKPRIGLAVEMYQRAPASPAAPDILALGERGRPFPVPRSAGPTAPVAAVDRIFDANDQAVERAVRRFARARGTASSPLGEDRYLRDMERYAAFACRRVIVELVAAERDRRRSAAAAAA